MFICVVCDYRSNSFLSFQRHTATHSRGGWQCPICLTNFSRGKNAMLHIQNKHPLQPVRPIKQPKICLCCFKRCNSDQEYHIHMATHEKVYSWECLLCHLRFPRRRQLTLHKASHEKSLSFRCDFCSIFFASSRQLKRHWHIVHQNVPMDQSRMEGKQNKGASTNSEVKLAYTAGVNNVLSIDNKNSEFEMYRPMTPIKSEQVTNNSNEIEQSPSSVMEHIHESPQQQQQQQTSIMIKSTSVSAINKFWNRCNIF